MKNINRIIYFELNYCRQSVLTKVSAPIKDSTYIDLEIVDNVRRIGNAIILKMRNDNFPELLE